MTEPNPKLKHKTETPDFSVLASELLFTLLPFSVLFIVYAYQDRASTSYLMAPEWAFASAILFGQTTVKFVQGIIEATVTLNPNAERVGLFVACLIVLGLVPSMVILALILVSPNPQAWLGYTQVVLFILAVATFLLLGAIAHDAARDARNATKGRTTGNESHATL